MLEPVQDRLSYLINQMKSNKQSITKGGADWVALALDPFHDYQRSIEGLPDQCLGRSVVRSRIDTVSASCTADGDNMAIYFTGYHGRSTYLTETAGGTAGHGPVLGTDQVSCSGPVLIIRAPYGTNPTLHNVVLGTATLVQSFPTVHNATISSRMIAAAIEVHDVTQELYRQGSVVVAPSNNCAVPANFILDLSTDGVCAIPGYSTPLIPAAAGEYTANPGSIIGPAAAGCYMIPKFQSFAEPSSPLSNGNSQARYTACSICQSNGSNTQYQYVAGGGTPATLDDMFVNGWRPSGFMPAQAFFSGLSEKTTLRITLKTMVEYFPDSSDIEMMSIATFSPEYDPVALQLYHSIATAMPIAVPVAMNAKGDYWRMLLSRMKSAGGYLLRIAPTALTALGQPELAAIAAAAGTMVRPQQTYQSISKPQKKKQNKKNKTSVK